MDGSDFAALGYLVAMIVTFVVVLRKFEAESVQKRARDEKADPIEMNVLAALGASSFWPLVVICVIVIWIGTLLTADLRRE